MNKNKTIENPFALSIEDTLKALAVTSEGLTDAENENRLEQYGYNELPGSFETPRWQILLRQFKSPIVYLLLIAAVISYFFGDIAESIAIACVILLNSGIGYTLESQAIHSMQALRKLDKTFCQVRRNGELITIESRLLVPGDIIQLQAGDMIPADSRLMEDQRLEVNEASLTGESVPVVKQSKIVLEEGTSLGDRVNMLYKGTSITKGNAVAVIVHSGIDTEIGKISQMVESADKDEIPLNEKLNQFGKKLIWLTLGLILIFIATGWIRGNEFYLILETAIALAVAAIPEGLPIVATISLARGMMLLSRENVIIKKLAAVETLGETDVIITDKTGTLTENQLVVHTVVPVADDGEVLQLLMMSAVLCNNSSISQDGDLQGDPVETALWDYFRKENPADFEKIRDEWKEVDELPFDSDIRYMANLYKHGEQFLSVAKGSPAELLDKCVSAGDHIPITDEFLDEWNQHTEQLAREGLKVLAFAAHRHTKEPSGIDADLHFLGLIGFLDPARSDVENSVMECHKAGITIIMATGDHPATAEAIARQIGLGSGELKIIHGSDLDKTEGAQWESMVEGAHIFSRVTPYQKLQLVTYYQDNGHIVGMTGDGVNDAPALKKSDIGIAMGKRGTQVAEEAADMIIQDDAFTSIVKAIRQGRIIFGNIRDFIIYLLSCNLTEIMVVSIAAFLSTSLPLLALQILFLNLVTDVFPALALGMGKGNERVMEHHSRDPNDPILDRSSWISIFMYSAVMTLTILAGYYYSVHFLSDSYAEANTIAFFSLALAQLIHPFNLTSSGDSFFRNPIFRNRFLWIAIVLCLILLAIALLVPFLNEILSLAMPQPRSWLIILLASAAPLFIIRIIKKITKS
ncbi:cation-translocating P-type ATPase [Fulvivirga sedimenti]|uniref:Cation-transporting P-type ATPase n=1 Tax=Fulvivirga sedimenti TaxID=2879465 RepID=A0A9X1KZC9_9BACT|nr:cation-transporting P-type ATPase [Fulvivirga sedimenti]MCA6074536.1 cation-transporting P-type ATPase [Fulvivirga sedimenti]MCA6075713.1 cation-transporting P-type ATPase [Fulvivirga sedimenti]MCA6076841.1 cation-transporting P-type ATPase [Fulvivirga sedimenti]